jgi:hypothetical protein
MYNGSRVVGLFFHPVLPERTMKSVNVRLKIKATFAHSYGTDGDTLIGRNSLTEVAIFVHLIHRKEICRAAVISV